ncbi:MAG: Cof-type HAD-IIB family hydrolase [Clostridiaceae bacterium]|nr:Cof-type HAD-IIB family hydrolase [Clostridiaceae bacterium]
MIKLIASDMDGTLLNNNHDIDKETVEAIRKAEEKGIIFAISTGREYGNVKNVLDKHNIRCQCIISSGAEYRDEDGNILESININEEEARKIIDILIENGLSARIFTNKGVYTKSTKEEALREVTYRTMTFNKGMSYEEAEKIAKEEGFFNNLKYIDELDEFFKEGIEVRKFVAFHENIELIKKIRNEVEVLGNLAVSSSFNDNIEITHIDAQKGIILERIAKKMGLKNNEVMVLGDSFNDYSMFEVFEESVAMKNAIIEIREIAKYITESNDNLGVAKAIMNVVNNTMDNMLK